jgi:hypothetical protein
MKKLCLIIFSTIFACAVLTACRTHERCAAYGKINKIDVKKAFSDKTENEV